MKRDKARPDFGWETPMDVYEELQRLMPVGRWAYFQRRDQQAGILQHVFEWGGRIRGEPYSFSFNVDVGMLRRHHAREIAEKANANLRRQLEEIHHQANVKERAGHG